NAEAELFHVIRPLGREAPSADPGPGTAASLPEPAGLSGLTALVRGGGLAGLSGLAALVRGGGVCVLSGAGLSTESGIPDYRGPSGALRVRLPMTIAEFRGSPEARQRYWARAHIGWQRIVAASPNAGHRAVAALQQAGLLRGI